MVWIHLAVLLAFIFLGARLGSLGVAYAGAAGVVVLGLLGCPVDPSKGIPWDVLGIIMTVISCIAVLQACGGLELLVDVSERMLRKNPRRITFVAPIITFFMTVFCGTGHVAFATLPVIAEVAKEQGIRPSRPLAIASVGSQIGICASPISAAVVAMTGYLEPMGISYLELVGMMIACGFVGTMAGAVVASRQGCELADDPVYQERLAAGRIQLHGTSAREIQPYARRGIALFAATLVVIMGYAAASSAVHLPLDRNSAIMSFMMTAALIMLVACHVRPTAISSQQTFRAGMSAALSVLGVAWLGNTFVAAHTDVITDAGASVLGSQPWLLAVVLLVASALLYSQGATTVAFMPVAASMGISGSVMAAAFPAVSGLFLLPTYPTTVAAVEFDDTGSTRIGKYVFNHPFMLPGLATIAVAVGLGFLVWPLIA